MVCMYFKIHALYTKYLTDRRAICMQLTEAMTQRTWGLHKLSVTLKLMDAKLADIVKSWESAELRRAGFSFKEVRKLVCALFEDTDYRAQMLQRMEVADID